MLELFRYLNMGGVDIICNIVKDIFFIKVYNNTTNNCIT